MLNFGGVVTFYLSLCSHYPSTSSSNPDLNEVKRKVRLPSPPVFFLWVTPWKFNSLPLKSYLPNRKVVLQPSFLRGCVKLRGGNVVISGSFHLSLSRRFSVAPCGSSS